MRLRNKRMKSEFPIRRICPLRNGTKEEEKRNGGKQKRINNNLNGDIEELIYGGKSQMMNCNMCYRNVRFLEDLEPCLRPKKETLLRNNGWVWFSLLSLNKFFILDL